MQLYQRPSHNSQEILVQVPYDSRWTFVPVSHDSLETFVQLRSCECCSVLFLAIKSRNGLIYVEVYKHLYHIFVALCGSRKLNCDVSVVVNLGFGAKHYCHFMLHLRCFIIFSCNLINMSCFMYF